MSRARTKLRKIKKKHKSSKKAKKVKVLKVKNNLMQRSNGEEIKQEISI